MPPAARSVEELFPLIEFCKNGDLKAVSDWIAKGNPLDLPPGKKPRRASPLQIAIEKGFLTLTEILLDGGADPASNGNALWIAVRAKRIDIVRLLLGERPIVKRNDIKAYGRYRTMETILQIYDALEEAARTGSFGSAASRSRDRPCAAANRCGWAFRAATLGNRVSN